MMMHKQNSTTEEQFCPFTKQSIERAYGPEVNLFLHCHLRGYDRHGDGNFQDFEYYDKYGAPVSKENSWMDGYHVVEKKLADHYNAVVDNELEFPLIAGMVGGVHLYKEHHDEPEEPWNWTGWIPRQKRWLCQGTFFSNRYFLGLRGNEVQNNLWDYGPYEQNKSEAIDELEYSQLQPNDRYRGGYWFAGQSFARYLHIIAVKCHEKDPKTDQFKRYNYIVHPLAYRRSIDTIPDNSVDAVQWSIIKIPEETHFGPGQPWGDRVHALEIFNDFTYYYSYQKLEESGVNNGELGVDVSRSIEDEDALYYYWFDTYPLEFAVFLLDSALARGVYLQTLAANDAFYERGIGNTPPKETEEEEVHEAYKKSQLESQSVLKCDPKGHLFAYDMHHRQETDPRLGVKKPSPEMLMRVKSISSVDAGLPEPLLDVSTEEESVASDDQSGLIKRLEFFKNRPYKMNTCFGYASLIDPRNFLKLAVLKHKDGIPYMGINEGEIMALDYLIEGRFFSTTGLWKLFQYEAFEMPYKIHSQPDTLHESLCYEMTEEMELVFTFAKCEKKKAGLVWRYTIMNETESKTLETVHGYFKLDPLSETRLDLRNSYDKHRVKWLYFTAISPENPQHRAWFSAIKGMAFGKPSYHAKIADLEHKVFPTTNVNLDTGSCVLGQATAPFMPFASDSGDLDFTLGKVKSEDKENIYVYFMQVYPHQQDFENPSKPEIRESSHHPPPRILQSVHGYFRLNDDYPTRLNLSASWDKTTVKDRKVYFYAIDVEKSQPIEVNLHIKLTKTQVNRSHALLHDQSTSETPSQPLPQPTSQSPSQLLPQPTSQSPSQLLPQPTSQSPSQLIPQPPSQSPSELIPQPTSQSPSQLIPQPTSQPSSQPLPQPTTQSPSQLIPQPTSQPSSQPLPQPTSQSPSQLIPQPTSQPSSQPLPRPTSQSPSQLLPQPTSQSPSQLLPQPTSQSPSQLIPQPTSQSPSELIPQPTSQSPSQLIPQPTSQPSSQPLPQPTTQSPSQLIPRPQPTSQPSSQPLPQPTSQSPSQLIPQPTSQPSSQPLPRPTSQSPSQLLPQPNSPSPSQLIPQPTSQSPSQPIPQPTSQSPSELLPQPTSQSPSQLLPQPNSQSPSELLPQPTSQSPSELLPQPASQSPSQLLPQPNSQSPSQLIPQPISQPSSQPHPQPTSESPSPLLPQPTSQSPSQFLPQPTSQSPSELLPQPNSQSPSELLPQPASQPSSQPLPQPTSQSPLQLIPQPISQPSSQPHPQPTFQSPSELLPQPTSQSPSQLLPQPTSQHSSQPLPQPTSQPPSQPLPRPTSQPPSQPFPQTISQPPSQSLPQTTSQPPSQSLPQPTSQPLSQFLLQPISQPSTQPLPQQTSQSLSQALPQTMSQPPSHSRPQTTSQSLSHSQTLPQTTSQWSYNSRRYPPFQRSSQPPFQRKKRENKKTVRPILQPLRRKEK